MSWWAPGLCMVVALGAAPARAGIELTMQADSDQVGVEDVFTLTINVSGASDDAQLELPVVRGAEIVSRSQSSQRVFEFGGSGAGVRRIERYTLLVRPQRIGKLVIPPARVRTPRGTITSEPVTVNIVDGALRPRRPPPSAQRQRPHGFGFPDENILDELLRLPDEQLPRSESDLFIRAYLDKSEAFVGEQVTLSVYIFSRVDLSSVDAVSLPKLDGFWSEDIESPSQLAAEQRTLDGVPYRAYLLKRRALFPVKAGEVDIAAPEADITTGFLFAGRRVHREGNRLALKVKPLPPGAPTGFQPEHVGSWKLAWEVEPTEVELGKPVTLRVSVEGRGNFRRLTLPRPSVPRSMRLYDPTTTDTAQSRGGRIGGRRAQEYLLMPQQTGSFTLPPLTFVYFDPSTERYETAQSDGITLEVKPGSGTAVAGGVPPAGAKNVLASGALRPVRHEAEFRAAGTPVWRRPLFIALTAGPVGTTLLASLAGALVRMRRRSLEGSEARRLPRELRGHLRRAEEISRASRTDAFFAELERALQAHLELRLGGPVAGYTRAELSERLRAAGVPEARRTRTLELLEACEMGRYAPGAFPATRDLLAETRALVATEELV